MPIQSVQPNTTTKKTTKLGAAAGAGASVAYIAAKRNGIFTQRSNQIVAKHADSFISAAKKCFTEPVAAKLAEATAHIGNKEKFAEVAKSAVDFIDDANMKEKFLAQMDNATNNIHKLIKKDKIKCIGGAVALTVGALAAGGAIVGNIIGRVIDSHNHKKEMAELKQLKEQVAAKYPDGIPMFAPVSPEKMQEMMNNKAYLIELLSY